MALSRYGGVTGTKNISEDFENINTALDNIEADVDAKAAIVNNHLASNAAHTSEQITHGPGSVKQALEDAASGIEDVNDRVDNLIITGGDSSPEVADARGGYPVLGARLDAEHTSVTAQLADIANGGFVGNFQTLPTIIDFNNLTTPGVYHGVLFDACYNEPIFPSAGARRVTIRVESQNPFIRQTITYESGFQSHSEYTRVFDGSWSEWVGVYNNFASLLPNGYQKLPSGVIIQWGAIQITMGGTVYDTGGLAFPLQYRTTNIVMSMNCSPNDSASWSAGQGNIYPMNESQFRILAFGDVGKTYYYRWMSVGF